MKYILYISIIIVLASCGSTESLVVKPEYTTTNSIYSLNVGMSESEVIKKLAYRPFFKDPTLSLCLSIAAGTVVKDSNALVLS